LSELVLFRAKSNRGNKYICFISAHLLYCTGTMPRQSKSKCKAGLRWIYRSAPHFTGALSYRSEEQTNTGEIPWQRWHCFPF